MHIAYIDLVPEVTDYQIAETVKIAVGSELFQIKSEI